MYLPLILDDRFLRPDRVSSGYTRQYVLRCLILLHVAIRMTLSNSTTITHYSTVLGLKMMPVDTKPNCIEIAHKRG